MIDMLILSFEKEISKERIDFLKKKYELYSQGVCDKHYFDVQVFKQKKDHFLTIKHQPRKFMSNLKPKIQINPSRFKSHKEVLEVFSDLEIKSRDLIINRIDLTVDLNISLLDLNSRFRVKNKQRRDDHHLGHILRGVCFGQKNNVTVIYDKAFQLEKETPKLQGLTSTYQNITRIETRRKNGSIPLREFNQLSKYIDFDPFSGITIYDLKKIERCNKFQEERFNLFKLYCEQKGFNHAYRFYNSSSNFSRSSLMKNLELSPLNQKIREIYRSNLRRYFND